MIGEFSALGAALLWALASILFAEVGRYVRAVQLNLIKGLTACLMMGAMLIFGTVTNLPTITLATLGAISAKEYAILVLSGVIGIAFGDTAYFACLRRIGPQKGLMLESTAPIIAAVLAFLLFGETLSLPAWCGIPVTACGVIIVVRWSQASIGFTTTTVGVLFGLLAAICQATGIVLSRQVLLSVDVEPLASGLVRLAAAVAAISLWLGIKKVIYRDSKDRQSIHATLFALKRNKRLLHLFAAIFLGTFLAIWLMQTAVKFTSAGITQTLLSTCPLFGMLFGLMQGYRQIPLVWFGLCLGIFGVSLLFLG